MGDKKVNFVAMIIYGKEMADMEDERYDALIFDLDGTLWNVNESCTAAWNEVLERLGSDRRITVEEMNSATGKPMEDIIRMLLPGDGFDHHKLYHLLNDKEEELVGRTGTYLYPGMVEEMEQLSAAFNIYIVSNCQEWYLLRFLDYSGIGRWLSGWDCYGMSGSEKYMMIARILRDNSIRNAVYIGDTALDCDSARRSGTDFIQMTYGFGKPLEGETLFGSFLELSRHLRH